jgi:transcriptional regulator with XRE-family HTH domain
VIEVDIFTYKPINKAMNPESVYRHIGALIRSRRKKFKPRWTQEKLANRIGISRASLANIETGRQTIPVHQLYAFAEALQLAPADFLLPANDAGAREEWDDVLPDDLKPQQRDQIARLLGQAQSESAADEGGTNAKRAKR